MNKYSAIKTTVDGIEFHSKKEARRYSELMLMQKGGLISELELQPSYRLEVNGKLVCKYVADFRYKVSGGQVVEDVKGVRTRAYRIKAKLFQALYPSLIFTET